MTLRFRFKGTALLPSLFSGLVFLLLNSCGSSSDEAAPPAVNSCESSQAAVTAATFNELYTKVLGSQCAACHGPGNDSGTAGGPDMRTADKFYEQVVGKKGSDYPDWDTFQKNREGCLAYDLINKGSAAESVLVSVLDRSVKPSGCDVKVHLDVPQSVCITTGNLAKLKEWINAGAPR
jgi:cytochrome c5